MSFGINVKGGTDGGRRRVRKLPEWQCACRVPAGGPCMGARDDRCHPEPGMCACFDGVRRKQLGRTYSCRDCGTRRPS